jgi:hypothetical protein
MSEGIQKAIATECDAVKALLLAKNQAYGDSAFEPLGVFSNLGGVAGIRVRIDDKLARVRNIGPAGDDEDTVLDLIGYLILLRVAQAKRKTLADP